MKREFLKTGDGSYTIHLPEWNEQYHSKHGALNEAKHVFIQSGLEHFLNNYSGEDSSQIHILEVGFGTGLNAFLSALLASHLKVPIHYHGIEAYPVEMAEVEKLNYAELLSASESLFLNLHTTPWEEEAQISDRFHLKKSKMFFSEISAVQQYDIIYFDAFGPRVQPDLWTEEIFHNMFKALKNPGVLTTYSAKGSVRRAMQAAGFKVERIPGPPGKREMLRATKMLP